MRTLDEIEPRIPIDSVPITIDQPGSYFLTGNLDSGANTAIAVLAPDVSLDLMGFTLSGTGANGIGVGSVPGATIRNGRISGFTHGIGLFRSKGAMIEGIQISGADYGIKLESNATGSQTKGNVIRNCVLASNHRGLYFFARNEGEVIGNRIIDTVIADNDRSGVEWQTLNGRIANNVFTGCTVMDNGKSEFINVGGFYFRPNDGGEISDNRIENCAIVFNLARAIDFTSGNNVGVFNNQVVRGNSIHNHDNAGIFIGGSLFVGTIDGVQIEDNAFSWNGFNGGVRSIDADDAAIRNVNVANNVLADNAANSTVLANLAIYSDRGTVYGNHISGASTHGLRIDDASRMVVAKNSVFGETLTITGDSTYGPIVETLPVPNNSWANFRLE